MILLNAVQRIDEKYLTAFLYENNYVHTLPSINQMRIHTTFFFSQHYFSLTLLIRIIYLIIPSEWRTFFLKCKYTESDALRWLISADCFRSS